MSTNKITFLEEYYPHDMFCFSNNLITWFFFNDNFEVIDLLSNLEHEQKLMWLHLRLLSWLTCWEEMPSITLSKPILITKNSNPELISNYLKEGFNIACDTFDLDKDMYRLSFAIS